MPAFLEAQCSSPPSAHRAVPLDCRHITGGLAGLAGGAGGIS
jgi:hypothetical protein